MNIQNQQGNKPNETLIPSQKIKKLLQSKNSKKRINVKIVYWIVDASTARGCQQLYEKVKKNVAIQPNKSWTKAKQNIEQKVIESETMKKSIRTPNRTTGKNSSGNRKCCWNTNDDENNDLTDRYTQTKP